MVIGQPPTLCSWAFTFILLLSTWRPSSALYWPPSPSEQSVAPDNAQDYTQPDLSVVISSKQAFVRKSCNSPSYVLISTYSNLHHKLPQNMGWKNPNMTTPIDFSEAALPLAPIAYESRGTFCHALIIVNHKPLIFTCFSGRDFGAKLFSHTAPALELVGVGRAGGHADSFIVVIAAGHASGVVVRHRAAPQAFVMATFVLVCTGSLATWAGAHCKTESKVAWTRAIKVNSIKGKTLIHIIYAFIPWALEHLCKRTNSCKIDKLILFFSVLVAWKYLLLRSNV